MSRIRARIAILEANDVQVDADIAAMQEAERKQDEKIEEVTGKYVATKTTVDLHTLQIKSLADENESNKQRILNLEAICGQSDEGDDVKENEDKTVLNALLSDFA